MTVPPRRIRPMAQANAHSSNSVASAPQSAHECQAICYGRPDARLPHSDPGCSSVATPAQLGFQYIFAGKFEAGDDFPYVVLAGRTHVGGEAAERRSLFYNTQSGAIERKIARTELDPRATFPLVNGAIVKERDINHQLAIKLFAALLRKIQHADIFIPLLHRRVVHCITDFLSAGRNL